MRVKGVLGAVVLSCTVGLIGVAEASAETNGGAAPAAAAAPSTTTGQTTVSQTKAVTLTRSQTKSVQRRIGVRADGAFGAQSRQALSRYQARRKLVRTGRPNLQTLRAMKLAFADAIEQKLAGTATPLAAPSVPPAAAGAPGGAAGQALATARAQIGTPYAWGGDDPSGFDCSGLVVYAFGAAGIDLPRTSYDQYDEGTAVDRASIQPGDLVFFATNGPGASHVGIATSATTAISATSSGVREHAIFDAYWGKAYVGARRVG
jgi:cell wall-associated NlpC family hydrolase